MIQLNLNHCDTAQQLLWQVVAEVRCDVAILAEPYHIPPQNRNWLADPTKSAAIWVTGRFPVQEVVAPTEEGFVIAKVNGVFFCSCYAPPRWPIERYTRMLDKLADALIGKTPAVIAGDFNAWSTQWGSRETTRRGQDLLETLARLDVDLANVGDTSTFRRNGVSSIIDVTFCSPCLLGNMDWRVDEGFTASDHQAIRYNVDCNPRSTSRGIVQRAQRWKTTSLNKEVLVEALRREVNTLNLGSDELMAVLVRACDVSMPRQASPRDVRRPVYWWTDEIAGLRASCLRARRKFQRARSEELRESRRLVYKAAKKSLGKAIRMSKKSCFGNLCQEANNTPWGDAYKIVMAKLKGGKNAIDQSPEMMSRIIQGLFPRHEETPWPQTPYVSTGLSVDEPIISNDELINAARALKSNKAPGPDGVPNQVLKVAIAENPDMFRTALQRCVDDGIFPDRWKRQRLVLLPKPGKPAGDPSAYRPICLIDTVGKLLEKVILNRLTKYTEREGGLSNRQFGFRKGRSTVDAINMVLETAGIAVQPKRRGMRFCAIVTLDVKNAFNSASWYAIARSLHRLKVPEYLCKLIKSYFENRVLMYETDEGPCEINITAGVPQGSMIGPLLWNSMYDGVLTLGLPGGVNIVGFADDIVLMVLGETQLEVEVIASEAVRSIEGWMESHKLYLAHQKTEVVVVNNFKSVRSIKIRAGNCLIESKRSIKYLGLMLDDKLNFTSHVVYACEKAMKAVAALTRMMANCSAVTSSRRRLIANVVSSILRYGDVAWGAALDAQYNLQRVTSVYRLMCLRVASAYRTVSADAACVVAGMVPIGLLVQEDVRCYEHRGVRGIRSLARNITMAQWQEQWDTSTKGRWTHRLIPSLTSWVTRKHGEVNFHLTQILTGHGCFRQYLHRFGHSNSPHCPSCEGTAETPEHVLFICPRFRESQEVIRGVCGLDASPDNILERMCLNESTWNAASRAISQIVITLQLRWRTDQREPQQATAYPVQVPGLELSRVQ